MYQHFSKVIFLLALAFVVLSMEISKKEALLMVALPQATLLPRISWDAQEEMLSSIEKAIVNINNDLSILSNVKLMLHIVDSGTVMCTYCPYSGNMLEEIANLTLNGRFADVLGIVGLVHPRVLNTLRSFQLPIVSLIHFSGLPYISNTFYMTVSTSTVAESVLTLVTTIGSDSIGVITEGKNTFYYRLSTELVSKLEHSSNLTIIFSSNIHDGNENRIINDIIASDIKVVFLSMNTHLSSRVLCLAYSRELLWPKYAWILHQFRFESRLPTENTGNDCNFKDIYEGIFIIQPSVSMKDDNNTYDKMSEKFKMEPISSLFYDIVYVLSVVSNNSDRLDSTNWSFSFNGASGYIQFDDQNFLILNIDIYQVTNVTASLVGRFGNAVSKMTHWNASVVLKDNTEVDIAFKKLLPTYVILCILIVLCFILNTSMLVLYVYFREEPDVKATSVSLSLLLFIGCYLLIGFAVVSAIWHRFTLIPIPLWQLCVLNTWLSGLGVSIPLILATLLVKMLRIHYIFTRYSRINFHFSKSDYALALYTVLIISPNIVVLVIWLNIDPFYDDLRKTEYRELNIIADKYHCKSNHQIVWFGLLIVFIIVLSTALTIVAIKTRKIRKKHFKDTKKVNLLIFLLLFITAFTLSFWLFFTELYGLIVLTVLVTGHLLAAFLCQFILVFPKVWPSLQKTMMYHN